MAAAVPVPLWPEPEQMASPFLAVTAQPVPWASSSLRSSPAAMLRPEAVRFAPVRNNPSPALAQGLATAPAALFVSLPRHVMAAATLE
jgi:hypothetical protein